MTTPDLVLERAIDSWPARALVNRAAAWCLAAALAALGLALIATGYINHDVAWYYYAAGRVLDGARLYVDIVDPNPPLVYYLDVPAVWAARRLGRDDLVAAAGCPDDPDPLVGAEVCAPVERR
jgi:hypothetical protein